MNIYMYIYTNMYVFVYMHVYMYKYTYMYMEYVYIVCVSLVGQGGFVVTMAPMQTYLDPTTSDSYTHIQ